MWPSKISRLAALSSQVGLQAWQSEDESTWKNAKSQPIAGGAPILSFDNLPWLKSLMAEADSLGESIECAEDKLKEAKAAWSDTCTAWEKKRDMAKKFVASVEAALTKVKDGCKAVDAQNKAAEKAQERTRAIQEQKRRDQLYQKEKRLQSQQ